jgi:hypothetical protein
MKLTRGERLTIRRRRLGLTQRQAARQHKVAPFVYGRWELDQGKDIPAVEIGALMKHERCFILRRREGHKQSRIAKALKVSRFWLNRMERGTAPCDVLFNYWREHASAA